MKKFFICLITIITFSIGCSTQSKKPRDYFPLIQGSTYEYEGLGNEYAAFKREVVFTDKEKAQIVEDNGGTVSTSIFRIKDDEISRIFFEAETYDKVNMLNKKPNDNTIILKSPLKVGTKWKDAYSQKEIVDTNAIVQTPAGKFDKCIKVKIYDQNNIIFEYFKEGVGMVKREFNLENAQIVSTLRKYSIKQNSQTK